MTEERKQSLHEISPLLCEAYRSLVDSGEVSFELHDANVEKIDSIVKTVNSHYFGAVRFSSAQEKAAAYFCLIIKDHPVTDGNKRLATLWLEVYTRGIGIAMDSSMPLDELAVSIESEKKMDIGTLIQAVRSILFR